MKKTIFITALFCLNVFASDDRCKVNILSCLKENSPKEAVRSIFEKNGFVVVDEATQAHFSATSCMELYQLNRCDRNQCQEASYISATTTLYARAMTQTNYFIRSAGSYMGQNQLPEILIRAIHDRGPDKRALRKSLEAFDQELKQIYQNAPHCGSEFL